MKRPFIYSLYVSQQMGQKPYQQMGRSEHFSRIPDSVLLDRELSAFAVRVYAFLAGRTRGNKPAVCGVRLIAAKLGMSKNTAAAALVDLEARGHVTPRVEGKQRRSYRLTSQIFRNSVVSEAGGEVIETYESDGVIHKQLIKSR